MLNPGAQRGLDIRKDEPMLRLPANKHTLLFFRLMDNTTVIKLESMTFFTVFPNYIDAGCPPFWREGFQSFENCLEFARHSKDYVETCVAQTAKGKRPVNFSLMLKLGGMKVKRAEHVSAEQTKLFQAALDTCYPVTVRDLAGESLASDVCFLSLF